MAMWSSIGVGFVAVIIGILYLLQQMHIFPGWPQELRFDVLWPLILTLVGLSGVGRSRRRIPWWPLYFTVLGLVWTAKNMKLWLPLHHLGGGTLIVGLGIIFFGLSLVVPGRFSVPMVRVHWSGQPRSWTIRASREARWTRRNNRRAADPGAQRSHTWFGDLSFGASPWVLKNMDVKTFAGNVRVNLATAQVDDGDHHINLNATFGDVRVLVPHGLPIHANVHVGVGDIQMFDDKQSGVPRQITYEEPGFAEAQRRVFITIDLSVGEVKLVRV